MNHNAPTPTNQSSAEIAALIIDYFHRTLMHHAMWFAQVQQRLGREKAWEIMEKAYTLSYDIQMKRLSKLLGFEMQDGLPLPLLSKTTQELTSLKESVAINWLAMDGVWFQAVENAFGMAEAKHCNDSAWGQFSPFEAWSIARLLQLPENPGLEGLKQALQLRLYASINTQEIANETPDSFEFRMLDCRVQSARKRKGLNDYPCKSGGIIEYSTFAQAIDDRIKTECLSCPPDTHPEGWYCAWRFFL
ncbi:MAG: DUF6125 family protein [Bacteroidota bacterium]